MKNKQIIICVSVFLLILLVAFPPIWNACIKETHNAQDFLNGNYQSFNGGEEAKRFFDEYAYTQKYKDIAFHYYDGNKQISFYYAWVKTIFVLDVWYEEDIFFNVVDEILADTDSKILYPQNYEYDGFYNAYTITKNDNLYVDNYAAFYIDVNHHTIRYFFVYDIPHDPGAVTDLGMYSDFTISIPWNRGPDNMVFDYSDIIDINTSEGSSTVITE